MVKQLLGGRTNGVNESHAEFLAVLDVVWLFWLRSLCNVAWKLGLCPFLRRGN